MRKLLLPSLMTTALLLSACGYHLVGHGDSEGAITADVKTVSLIVRGESDRLFLANLKQRLSSDKYALIEPRDVVDQQGHANLNVSIAPLRFTPSAYDAAGVATQYHMTFSGSLTVERDGKSSWQSGLIQTQGEVYVAGGPTSIEASRERMLKDLRKQWLQDALGRVRSGF